MASGPTQNYDDPTLVGWRPHPVLARVLRVGLAVLPAAVAVAVAVLAVRHLPPERVGLHPWLWLALLVAGTSLLLVALGQVTRRLLPLTALLRLSLVLPDRVPSRFAAIRRRSSLENLLGRVEEATAAADPDAAILLELVGALSRHDRATFRHSERVQAYATLIGRELGLGPADAARLGWAALLHDIGKLTVPAELLNKPGRPDAREWATISRHAAAGSGLVAPLARWLGPWAAVIDQHHERWDGGGYPRGLAGEQISPGARIVAVADAFDVITSARAYKSPLPPDAARAELARCAGTQFDAQVVRAFLAVGLGELRAVAGPIALVGALPALGVLQQGAAQTLGRAAGAASPAATAMPSVAAAVVVGAGLAVASPVLSAPAAEVTDSSPAGDPSGDVAPLDGAGHDSGTPAAPPDGPPTDPGPGDDGDTSGAVVLQDAEGAGTDPDGSASGDPVSGDPVSGDPVSGDPASDPETAVPPSDDGAADPGAPTGGAPTQDGAGKPASDASPSGVPGTAADPAREAADGAVGPADTPDAAGPDSTADQASDRPTAK